MRAPMKLRSRGRMHRMEREAAAIATGVHMALNEREEANASGFSPTSGFASTELAPGRWMPHDHRPIRRLRPQPLPRRHPMTCSCGLEPDPGVCNCGLYGGSHCACAPHPPTEPKGAPHV
jgi:hypothetical protein